MIRNVLKRVLMDLPSEISAEYIYSLENAALGHTKRFEQNCKNITFDTSFDGSVALEENTGFVFSLVRGLWLFGAILKFPKRGVSASKTRVK